MKAAINILFVYTILIFGCKQADKVLPDNKLAVMQLKEAFDKKNDWLVSSQYDSLETMIHKDVVYGHSNCWVQDYNDLVTFQEKDSLAYIGITPENLEVNVIGATGIVYGNALFKGIYKLDTFDMNLCFVETYSYLDNKWTLVGRQSAKKTK